MYLLKLLEKAYSVPSDRLRRIIFRVIRRLEGGYFYEITSRNICKKYYDIELGYGTAGYMNLSSIARGTVFGNYCGIVATLHVRSTNHPAKYFTTHALMFNPIFGVASEDVRPRAKLIVGHDVLFGLNTIVLPSVNRIGNGAIIGAGAIVTKNVDNYAIVGGNPAKLIAYRFPPDVIAQLEESKWWLLSKNDLINNKEKFEKIVNFSLDDFKKQHNERKNNPMA
jgi:virginiamycin A acetyltransferase